MSIRQSEEKKQQRTRSASRATFLVDVEEERITAYVWAMVSSGERDSCCFLLNTITDVSSAREIKIDGYHSDHAHRSTYFHVIDDREVSISVLSDEDRLVVLSKSTWNEDCIVRRMACSLLGHFIRRKCFRWIPEVNISRRRSIQCFLSKLLQEFCTVTFSP